MSEQHLDEPLGLAVHSMPVPTETVLSEPAFKGTGRWKMLAIMLVCSLPVMAAYFVYFVVRPTGHAGYGELITPLRPVPDAIGTALDGSTHALGSVKGQWLLVAVAGGACPQDCQQRLYLLRQLREMLGKDKERVDWVWLVSDQESVAPSLQNVLKDATVLRLNGASLESWMAVPAGQTLNDFIYVVDPLGNTMMRFPGKFDGSGAAKAKRDLERLLRASASWDAPGR